MLQEELKQIEIPTIAVRGVVLFPKCNINLEVGRKKSKLAVEIAEKYNNNYIFVATQKNPFQEDPKPEDLYKYGTIGRIKMKMVAPDGSINLVVEGIERARVVEFVTTDTMFQAKVEKIHSLVTNPVEEEALVRKLISYIEELININPTITVDLLDKITGKVSAEDICNIIAFHLPNSIERKQQYLEVVDINNRIKLLLTDINREKQLAELDYKIEEEIKQNMTEAQKEYYLREKLRIIREELGDISKKDEDFEELHEKIINAKMPKHIEEKVLAELKRYDSVSASSGEAGIIRTYIEWLIQLPWTEETEDANDLKHAKKVLDESHYGLEKVKERIIEYLAVKKMTQGQKGTVLCFVGPPGVGKTSLAKSIAESLGRRFVKVSLGGVKDEAEIRGHRRTYIGALPGRIIQGMKKAGTINPVFLLDEIDKMSSDYKGDPVSAMLEVLDPEQNKHFSDHYIEEEYDLSKVMFITTANYLYNIPEALRDRLEIIELGGYTEYEKLNIAKGHIIPKVLKEHGLTNKQITFTDSVILTIIREYTKEAGVRELERLIAKTARKVVTKIITGENKIYRISNKNIKEYLGNKLYQYGKANRTDQVGVATGLAYTQYGGDILPIEVSFYKGKGKLELTGQLGEVMKESAQIALSYVKTHAEEFGIDYKLLEENDIHIHVPEGAIPKDGPSAGITLTIALISALTNRPVRHDVGMTGEMTLRGEILPIGGLREKTLGAARSGIKTVIIPRENENDLEEIPKEVKEKLEFVTVKNLNEVINIAVK